MSHRVFLLAFVYLATWGVSARAIAAKAAIALPAGAIAANPLISQANNNIEAPSAPVASEATRNLQARLTQLGYYQGPLDGIPGAATQQALAQFQEAAGLVGTGLLDPLTQERLQSPEAPRAAGAEQPSEANPFTEPETPTTATPDTPALDNGEPPANADPLAPTTESANPLATGDPNANANPDGASEAPPEDATAPTDGSATDKPAATAGEAKGKQAGSGGLLRLALVGFMIVLVGGLGGAALLLLTRRGQANDDPLMADSSHEEPETDPVSKMPHRAPQNGSVTGDRPPMATTTLSPPQSVVTPSESPSPRLAKVNIIDELIQDLDNPDPTVRRKAIWELGQRGNSAAVSPLVSLMMNVDSHEQSLILAALAEISTQTLKPLNRALAISLQDENPEVRKNAIRDLTRIYELMGQAGRILGHAASDHDTEVRQTASWALNQLNRMRLNATEATPRLQEGSSPMDQLPEEGSSPRSF